MGTIIIIKNYPIPYVLIAPEDANIDKLKDEYFKDLIVTDETLKDFVKTLVAVHGFARLDNGCDFIYLDMPTYSLD